MAAVLHLLDQRRLIDSNGISDGASIAFYLTGTTTPTTIYSDVGLTTPLTNPVVVAAGAAVPNIYLSDAVTYRRVITYSDGETDDTDPYTTPYVATTTLAASGGSALVGFLQSGTGATARTVQAKLREVVSVTDFGAVGDGVTDDVGAFRKAITAASATNRQVFVPTGTYRFNSTLNITDKGVRIFGTGFNTAANGGSQIIAYGCDAIVYGSDSGNPWTNNEYDGKQGQQLFGLFIQAGTKDTNLLCDDGTNTYKYAAGYSGVTDWRGGDIDINQVRIDGFEYNFKGIQSDINCWGKVQSTSSKYGIYAGPRSDQFHIDYLYSFFCDRALTLDTVDGFTCNYINIVFSGGAAVDTVEVRRGCGTVWIGDVWIETRDTGQKCRAFLGAGTVDGYASNTTRVQQIDVRNVTFYGPSSGGNILGAIVAMGAAIVQIGNIKAFRGAGLLNIDDYIVYPADQTATGANCICILNGMDLGNIAASKLINKLGSGSPAIITNSNLGAQQYLESTSSAGIVIRERDTAGTTDRRLQISSSGLSLTVDLSRLDVDTGTDQQKRVYTRRSWQTASAMPTSGAWRAGDRVYLESASIAGTAPHRYVLMGYNRITTGSNHVLGTDWAEMRMPIETSGGTTVAALPAAGTAGSGARGFVTDATATTFASTVAGGGANKVPVFSDGTNWLIG